MIRGEWCDKGLGKCRVYSSDPLGRGIDYAVYRPVSYTPYISNTYNHTGYVISHVIYTVTCIQITYMGWEPFTNYISSESRTKHPTNLTRKYLHNFIFDIVTAKLMLFEYISRMFQKKEQLKQIKFRKFLVSSLTTEYYNFPRL